MYKIKKWIFFKVLLALQSVGCIVMICLLFKNLLTGSHNEKDNSVFMLLVTLAILFIFSVFSFAVLNIYLLQKNYPDRNLSRPLNVFFNINLVLYCCVGIAIIIFLVYAVNELMILKDAYVYEKIIRNTLYKAMAFWTFFLFTIICVMILSLKLKKEIKVNFLRSQSAQINEIGQETAS